MKFIFHVIYDIIDFIKKKTLVFLVLLLGLTTCFSAFIYFHADNLARYKELDSVHMNLRHFTMYFENSNLKSVLQYIDQEIGSSNYLPEISRLYAHTYIEDGNYILTGYYGNSLGYALETGRDFHSATNTERPVLLSSCLLDFDKLMNISGAQFAIQGKQYNVIGTGVFPVMSPVKGSPEIVNERNAIIPLEDYKKVAGSCATVDFYFETTLTESQLDQFIDTFYTLFPHESLSFPVPSQQKYLYDIYLLLLLILLGAGLSLVNVFSFYRYWISYNTKKYYTYIICGCTRIWLYSHIVFEAIIITSVSFGLGLLVYHTISPLLIPLGYLYYRIDIGDIWILYICCLFLTLLFAHTIAWTVSRQMPQALRRQLARNIGGDWQ
jgi:hypothetical protein